jgi:hypothetical protein
LARRCARREFGLGGRPALAVEFDPVDGDRLASAAIAVVGVTAKYCVDFDWGPLLAAAFPNGDGTIKTPAQRRFLRTLVGKAGLWDPTLGNALKWFKQAGLPYERKACARLLANSRR